MKKRFFALMLSMIVIFSASSVITTTAEATSSNSNVILSIPWNLINKCGHQSVSGPCQAYCWSYCRIILDNRSHKYIEYWTSDGAKLPSAANYNDGQTANTKAALLKIVYENINLGRPVVLRVVGSSGWSYHFVVAVGYRAGCDFNNLSEKDILILDPANKSIKESAGSNETYSYLNSHTLSGNRYWTAKSGGVKTISSNSKTESDTSITNKPTMPTVSSSTGGNWIVTIPANYKLPLYFSAESTSTAGKYVSAKSSSYQIVCTKRATLSNGSVRYYALFNSTNDPYWFVYGNGMTIQNMDTSKTFKITFDPISGTVSSANKTVSTNSTYGTLPTPVRNGYIFDGWYTTKSGGTKITASTTVNLTSDQTLYAHWTSVKTYTVTFDANGGSIDQTTRNIQAGSPIGALPTPNRSGYKFIGWKDVKEGSGMIVNSETFIVEGDLKLYANWSKIEEDNTVTISFNANGGSVTPSVKTIKVGESYGNLPTPSRDGYVFDGWYTASQDGSRITSSTVATKNLTLYAYWSANTPKKVYTIYFDVNGGMNSSRQSKTVTAGKPYGAFPVPARNGYSFDGWYTSQSGGEKIYESMIVNIDSDQTLYAHWSKEAKTYTVVFDPNGGSVSPQTKTVTAGFAYGELPMPTYDGFIFLGWYTGKTKITSSSIYDLNRDITLYAQWEREQLQDEIESPPESSLKIEGLNVSVSQKGIIPQYIVSSNYPINYLWTSLNDPNGDLIQGGNTSFNPAYKIYETDDSGIIYSFALFQSMDAYREYSFTVEARDESGKAVTATATFVMPFSIKNGEIVP